MCDSQLGKRINKEKKMEKQKIKKSLAIPKSLDLSQLTGGVYHSLVKPLR